MKIGYIGLGKMGLNMVKRLREQGVDVVAFNKTPEPTQEAETAGAEGAYSIKELVEKLGEHTTIWVMVPHFAVDEVLNELSPLLPKGAIVVDGGNSHYEQTKERNENLASQGVRYLDCGVSGGPGGARNGACCMVGGDQFAFEEIEELFQKISAPDAYGYFGPSGSGHFVKMVHNGIEYGMMQAIAEGFDIMKNHCDYDLNLEKVADVYNHESVITSKLIGWMKLGYEKFGKELAGVPGSAAASGEGKWTIDFAHKISIPDEVIHAAYNARKKSQDSPSYQGKIIQTLRNQFGGHPIDKSDIIS